MKNRSEIWLCALEEFGAQCSVSTERDAETLARRVAREGDSFLKVALPAYGKDFEVSLAMRVIPHHLFRGFSRKAYRVEVVGDGPDRMPLYEQRFSGGTPKFLGSFLDLVFCNDAQMSESELEFATSHSDFVLAPHIREFLPDELEKAASAVTAIRQLCLMFGKEKERCSAPRVEAAYSTYIETDKSLDSPLGTSE